MHLNISVLCYSWCFCLKLYYTSNICMCWAPALCQARYKSLKGNGGQTSHDIWPTNKHKITNMRGTSRNCSGCLIHGPHKLCPPDPHPLVPHLSGLSNSFHYQPHRLTWQPRILFSQLQKLTLSLFPLTIAHVHSQNSNIYILETPFLPTSPD